MGRIDFVKKQFIAIIQWTEDRAVTAITLCLMVLLCAPALAMAATLRTFYVAPTGSDAAAGSSTSPWRTLQKAAAAVQAGDLVIVRAGTYAGFDLWTSGTAADPIVFRADPGVVVNAPNPRTSDGLNLEGASYVVIEGFTVSGVPRAGIRSVINHHVTIRNNIADLNGRWGIFTGFSDDLLIENNVTSRSQLEHGIYVSNSGDRPVIRHNVTWGNYANGIHMNGDLSQGGDGVISNALVERNTIYENGRGGGSGINCDGVRDSRIQNNLLFDNHASGISLYRIDGGDGSRNNVVVHNTIVQAADARWAINIQDGSTGTTLYDNILYNQHPWRGSISLSPDSRPGFTSDYNVVMERFTLDDGDSVLTLAQWRGATGQDGHSIVAAPAQLFVDPAADDYRLRDDSPARDAGLTLADVTEDIEGTPRPGGPASDIGAFEIAGASPDPTLTVTRAGNGNGAVTSAPAGIDCGADCSQAYIPGTTVTLTATAVSGSGFVGWSGGCTGSGSCAVTMSADISVTATFSVLPPARPDLVELSVSSPPASIRRKGTFSVTDRVRNQGTGASAASMTRYYLSSDAVRNGGDQLLTGTRSVPALAAGTESAGTVSVKVPNSMPTGSYFLLACADDRNSVAESDEANNCVASATRITVTK